MKCLLLPQLISSFIFGSALVLYYRLHSMLCSCSNNLNRIGGTELVIYSSIIFTISWFTQMSLLLKHLFQFLLWNKLPLVTQNYTLRVNMFWALKYDSRVSACILWRCSYYLMTMLRLFLMIYVIFMDGKRQVISLFLVHDLIL